MALRADDGALAMVGGFAALERAAWRAAALSHHGSIG